MKELYVLVLVDYFRYRYQTNLFVGSEESCRKEIDRLFTNYPIYKYDRKSDLSKELDSKERVHYWLQKFNVEL